MKEIKFYELIEKLLREGFDIRLTLARDKRTVIASADKQVFIGRTLNDTFASPVAEISQSSEISTAIENSN